MKKIIFESFCLSTFRKITIGGFVNELIKISGLISVNLIRLIKPSDLVVLV